MRRGKRFLENDNMFIYVGTVIFILLAVVLGIIMYMTTKTDIKIDGNITEELEKEVTTESVTSEIGKTVEEQTENINSNNEQIEESKVVQPEPKIEQEVTTPVEKPIQNETIEIKKEITFSKPVEGEIICEYAKDNLIYSETLKEWITHPAIDIKTDKTSVIKSAADGVIKSIVNDPRYGLTVVIGHDEGYETVYSNLLTAEFIVEGEEVAQGQTIGTAGNTAAFESEMECHLHFELLKDGEYLDPTIYLK